MRKNPTSQNGTTPDQSRKVDPELTQSRSLLAMNSTTEAPTAAVPFTLPRGVVYRFKADRPDLPHQLGGWDKDLRRYAWESFSDKAKGAAWARQERGKM